jgi:hypothetical protein
MQENYEERLLDSGRYCSIMILHQDGPISQEICEVTLNLLKLAEQCWNPTSLKALGKRLPSSQAAAGRMGAVVGGGLHHRLYDLAKKSQAAGWLPPELKITRPANRRADPNITLRGLNSAAGPDFVLRGRFGGQQIDAAWDFTTNNALASHYDRDVLGRTRGSRPRPDLGIQQIEDTTNFWTSYIAICY